MAIPIIPFGPILRWLRAEVDGTGTFAIVRLPRSANNRRKGYALYAYNSPASHGFSQPTYFLGWFPTRTEAREYALGCTVAFSFSPLFAWGAPDVTAPMTAFPYQSPTGSSSTPTLPVQP